MNNESDCLNQCNFYSTCAFINYHPGWKICFLKANKYHCKYDVNYIVIDRNCAANKYKQYPINNQPHPISNPVYNPSNHNNPNYNPNNPNYNPNNPNYNPNNPNYNPSNPINNPNNPNYNPNNHNYNPSNPIYNRPNPINNPPYPIYNPNNPINNRPNPSGPNRSNGFLTSITNNNRGGSHSTQTGGVQHNYNNGGNGHGRRSTSGIIDGSIYNRGTNSNNGGTINRDHTKGINNADFGETYHFDGPHKSSILARNNIPILI